MSKQNDLTGQEAQQQGPAKLEWQLLDIPFPDNRMENLASGEMGMARGAEKNGNPVYLSRFLTSPCGAVGPRCKYKELSSAARLAASHPKAALNGRAIYRQSSKRPANARCVLGRRRSAGSARWCAIDFLCRGDGVNFSIVVRCGLSHFLLLGEFQMAKRVPPLIRNRSIKLRNIITSISDALDASSSVGPRVPSFLPKHIVRAATRDGVPGVLLIRDRLPGVLLSEADFSDQLRRELKTRHRQLKTSLPTTRGPRTS